MVSAIFNFFNIDFQKEVKTEFQTKKKKKSFRFHQQLIQQDLNYYSREDQ